MRHPSSHAVLATFEALHEQTRSALMSGLPFCGVAHFPQGELPDASLLLESFDGNSTLVRAELLVLGTPLLVNTRFELYAGQHLLARGRVLLPAVLDHPTESTYYDKPAPRSWQGEGSLRTRGPLPPEQLVDALQDRVHPASGHLLCAKPLFPQRHS